MASQDSAARSAPAPSWRRRTAVAPTAPSTLGPHSDEPSIPRRHSATPTQNPSSSSWFNTLADGLNWIETQGGNVVSQATQAGIGETIRGGLQGVGGVVQGGLAKRPLPLPSRINGVLGSTSSEDQGEPVNPLSQGVTPVNQRRPASFLGLIKPNVQPDPNEHAQPKAADSTPAFVEPFDHDTSSVATSTHQTPAHRPGPLSTSFSSPPPTAAPGRKGTEASSSSTLGVPTVTRLGPPRPANLSRLRHADSDSGTLGTAAKRGHRSTASQSDVRSGGIGVRPHAMSSSGSLQNLSRYQDSNTPSGRASVNMTPPTSMSGASAPVRQSPSQMERTGGVERSSSLRSNHSSRTGLLNVNTPSGPSHRASYSSSINDGSISSHNTATQTPLHPSPTVSARTRLYKPGFQPPGVKSSKTEEFERARRKAREEGGRDEGRLGRRWAKLVDLHFNPIAADGTNSPGEPSVSSPPAVPSHTRSASSTSRLPSLPSMPSLSLSTSMTSLSAKLDNVSRKDLWRGFRSVTGVGLEQVSNERKREAERSLVKWEEDGDVSRCRICQSMFSMTNRKHHCRLCGRIICSLPPTSPEILSLVTSHAPAPTSGPCDSQDMTSPSHRNLNPRTGLPVGTRREKCSLLLVGDYRTGRGQEVEEGFVGWMKVGSSDIAGTAEQKNGGDATKGKEGRRPDEVQVKGLRTCRECWRLVSRKQKMADMNQTSRFTKLYGALKSLEEEILDALPDFQEMMSTLSAPDAYLRPIPPETILLHKHLLALFSEYDIFTKQIRNYPCDPTSAQERVQLAIARQAGLFMAKEAGVLQLLPQVQKARHKRVRGSLGGGDKTPSEVGSGIVPPDELGKPSDDERAMMLQPLLEQEAQLETFIAEAKATRKFEDAKTLTMSLDELRSEIVKIASA